MTANTSRPLPESGVSYAGVLPRYITFAREWVRGSATQIATFCLYVIYTIGLVGGVSLFMLALVALNLTMALSGTCKRLSTGYYKLIRSRAARVDANQATIVKELRAIGCSVQPLNAVGDGCPDILVGSSGKNFLFEVKDPAQPPSNRKLTAEQIEFIESWRGDVSVILTADDAIEIINAVTWTRRNR